MFRLMFVSEFLCFVDFALDDNWLFCLGLCDCIDLYCCCGIVWWFGCM